MVAQKKYIYIYIYIYVCVYIYILAYNPKTTPTAHMWLRGLLRLQSAPDQREPTKRAQKWFRV